MTDSSKKSSSKASNKTTRSDTEAIADLVLSRQRGFLEARFDSLEKIGKETEGKLSKIQADLATVKGNVGSLKGEIGKVRADVQCNSTVLATHAELLEDLQCKMAAMEDRSRRCNLRIVNLAEGVEGSNAVHYLTNVLPQWFPKLGDIKGEIMRAHRIYTDDTNRKAPRTLIFNVLRFTTHQRIFQAAKHSSPQVKGRKIRFSLDYSAHTLKRRQAFYPVLDAARAKGVDARLRYPATLRVKYRGETDFFESATDAEAFINSLPHFTPLVAADDAVDPAGEAQLANEGETGESLPASASEALGNEDGDD